MSEAAEVRFWGTRGSIPTPGSLTDKYGGNTTCLELIAGDTHLVFDAGSGIRELGRARMQSGQAIDTHLLFTHMHWDHIQGFPFFTPAYLESTRLQIYSAVESQGGAEEILGDQMEGVYFPVPISAMRGTRLFHPTRPQFLINDLQIRTTDLPHPGGCLAFRVTAGNHVFVLATDCELDLRTENADELAANPLAPRRYPQEFLEFFLEADLLVIDLQYTDEAYEQCRGWGHNSVATVADFIRQTAPRRVAFTHHDPGSTDDDVARIAATLIDRLAGLNVSVFAAREGMSLALGH